MKREIIIALSWALLITVVLASLVLFGSRNLAHFDAALVAYTASILFASFGLTYRYAMWLQRPPTAIAWRRGWHAFLKRGHYRRNAVNWARYVTEDILANRFIFARTWLRGVAHLLIMWGCIMAIAITFPLVFGWLHFESVPGDLHWYQAYIFGFPTFTFPLDSLFAFLLFHGLVWASFLVIAGVMLAMRRRMREENAAAVQIFSEDFMPLILLFAVSLTGLMLTASYTWLRGYAYDFIAILHALTVIGTFLWLPFGKFFHIFQRPAQIGVRLAKEIGKTEEPALCRRCGAPFTAQSHVADLIEAEQALGYRYQMAGHGPLGAVEHYQWICPPCRRALVALAQAKLWQPERQGVVAVPPGQAQPTPVYVNPARREGPLGWEDEQNFHL